MCGICGIIDRNQGLTVERKRQLVAKMNAALVHRGPDDEGNFTDHNCSLAMRRLSIIDLPGGKQPIFNETGDIVLFFNGEIYNYLELRAILKSKGHRFSTKSDTEVLVHLYEEYQERMLPLLKGMFAFCLYDIQRACFLLARDRFGEKPLFYYQGEKHLSFASEPAALLEDETIPRTLNTTALPYYFRTSLVPEPMTLLKGVKSLNPGHYLKITPSAFEHKPYFQLHYKVDEHIRTDEEAIEFIRPVLNQAINRQSVSDVPIGAFLSGGIDSSTVVATLQKHADHPIQTFTVRFEDQTYDESGIARKVADHLGTDHHELFVPNYHFDERIFWEIIDHVGMPFRDSSAIPSYFISREIRKQVKVALSGDGGDELFGGYRLFQWYQQIMRLKTAPRLLRKMGDRGLALSQKLPGLRGWSPLRQLKRAMATSLQNSEVIPISLNELFTQQETIQLTQAALNGHAQQEPFNYSLLKQYPEGSETWSPLRKIMYYRARHTLPANMLVKVDRMSMANSLEVRAPFLDPDLFDAAARLPDRFLIRGGKGKYILKKIMEQDLPRAVFDHPKQGFSIPLYKYQNEAFNQLAQQLIIHNNPFPQLFSQPALEKIYFEGIHHRKNNANLSVFRSAHRLWMLMQLFGWAKRFKVSL